MDGSRIPMISQSHGVRTEIVDISGKDKVPAPMVAWFDHLSMV
jgi:hypothetical protein